MTDHTNLTPDSLKATVEAGLSRVVVRRSLDWGAAGLLVGGLSSGLLAVLGLLPTLLAIAATLAVGLGFGWVGYVMTRRRASESEVLRSALKAFDLSASAHDGLLTIATTPAGPFTSTLQRILAPAAQSASEREAWLPPRRRGSWLLAGVGLVALLAGAIAGPVLWAPQQYGDPEPEVTRGIDPDGPRGTTDDPLRPVPPDSVSTPQPSNDLGGESEPGDSDSDGEGKQPGTDAPGDSARAPEARTSVPTTLRPSGSDRGSVEQSDQEGEDLDIPPPARMPWERPIAVPGVTPRERPDTPLSTSDPLPEVGERRRPPISLPPPTSGTGQSEFREDPMKILPEVRDGERKSVPVQRTVYQPGSRLVDSDPAAGDGSGDGGEVAPLQERQPLARGALSEDELRWLALWRAQFPIRGSD